MKTKTGAPKNATDWTPYIKEVLFQHLPERHVQFQLVVWHDGRFVYMQRDDSSKPWSVIGDLTTSEAAEVLDGRYNHDHDHCCIMADVAEGWAPDSQTGDFPKSPTKPLFQF